MGGVAGGGADEGLAATQRGMKTVLVADDEASLRLLVSATIESDRWTIVEAGDGDEAWELLRRHRPAVALLDVQMAGRSGLELTRRIRSDRHLAGTHVILLTARAQESDIQAGLEAGADRYIVKPFSPHELLTAVEQAVASA